MSDYCNCCSTNNQHIAEHYDPDGLIKYGEDASYAHELFHGSVDASDNPCPLTLGDVQAYIDSLEPADVDA